MTKKELVKLLRKYRRSHGLTQTDLYVIAIGCSLPTGQNWENARSEIYPSRIYRDKLTVVIGKKI